MQALFVGFANVQHTVIALFPGPLRHGKITSLIR
jgi:hypothetical protein